MWDEVWKVANSNLVILLLGSGLGFLFVRVVWEPYKKRLEETSHRRTMREEALFRLLSVENEVATDGRGIGYKLDGLGDFVPSLNPLYRSWSLAGLIFAGWGKDILSQCSPHVAQLKQATEKVEIDEFQNKEKAQVAIDALKRLLQV